MCCDKNTTSVKIEVNANVNENFPTINTRTLWYIHWSSIRGLDGFWAMSTHEGSTVCRDEIDCLRKAD